MPKIPNYDYLCKECEVEKEINVSIEERDLQRCPTCGDLYKRLIRFHGTVWAPTSTGGGHK